AIFSGLMPSEMERLYPELWKNDVDDGGKNLYEKEFLATQIKRLGLDIKWSYHKISNLNQGKKLVDSIKSYKDDDLLAVVYNFVDILSHSKTEMEVIKELATTERYYRYLTNSSIFNSCYLMLMPSCTI